MTKMSDSRDHCSGNVMMSYEGDWLPVCKKALDSKDTQNTICGELKCGRAEGSFTTGSAGRSISIQCPANSNSSLRACTITTDQRGCVPGGLQCSSMCYHFVSN